MKINMNATTILNIGKSILKTTFTTRLNPIMIKITPQNKLEPIFILF
jgi:hypothetical protein